VRQYTRVPALTGAGDTLDVMRSGALLIACVVAACNSGTGVDIDIYAPEGVKVHRVDVITCATF